MRYGSSNGRLQSVTLIYKLLDYDGVEHPRSAPRRLSLLPTESDVPVPRSVFLDSDGLPVSQCDRYSFHAKKKPAERLDVFTWTISTSGELKMMTGAFQFVIVRD